MDTSRLLAITDKLTDRQTDRQTDKQTDRQTDIQTDKTDRQNSNMTWIAIGLGEVRRTDERFTPAVPLWSRQWTSRCRRPRKLFYIDFLLIFSRHDLPSASRRRKMLPCTEEEVEALFYFILFLIYTSLSTLFGPSRSPFLTSRRYTVWEWHKRSLRVNTRLQRESAIKPYY